jgi:outer membrane protein OmpA-like peptidoglycan-associated protein
MLNNRRGSPPGLEHKPDRAFGHRSRTGHNQRVVARLVCAAVAAATLLLAGCAKLSAGSPEKIVIAATATENEPAPALSWASQAMLRAAATSSSDAVAYVVNPTTGQPDRVSLTPRRANGEVEYGPQRGALIASSMADVQTLLHHEAATGPFNLLNTMLAASRVTSPPATMLLLSSGVTTAGGFNLQDVGWDANPDTVATQLKQRGMLPDLSGWTVVFSGLGVTAGRQPALALPQQTTLTGYWLAICHATGAAACRIDDSPRPRHPSPSLVPVPVVPVPAEQSVVGPRGQVEKLLPNDLLFAFGSARLLAGADSYLTPIAEHARAAGLWLSITGQASPDGGTTQYNLGLSLARARAVRTRLMALGVPAGRIAHVTGVGTAGQTCTVGDVPDEAACAQLRRVVIDLSPSPPTP